MKNADMPAMPNYEICHGGEMQVIGGLTKREQFAMAAPEAPEWFVRQFKPINLPEMRQLTEREISAYHGYAGHDFGCKDWDLGEAVASEISEHNSICEKMTTEQCYFSWRTYYADALLKELEK